MPLFPPQAFRKTEFTHRIGLAAARPAAADVLIGTLYFSTDTLVLERSNGAAWSSYSGIVANSVTLAMLAQVATQTVLGRSAAGAGDVSALTTLPNAIQDAITRLGTIVLGFVTNAVAALTTAAESWIGPSSTTGVYFKTGQVGIGTITPAALLNVAKNQATGTEIRIDNTDAAGFAGVYLNVGFGLGGTTGAFYQWNNQSVAPNVFLSTQGAHPFYLGTDNTVRMAIKPTTGFVGIGTLTTPSMLTVAGLVNLKNYTVATLPAAVRGDIAYVTDALAPTFLAIIVGGGAVVTPVFFNGTNWVGF